MFLCCCFWVYVLSLSVTHKSSRKVLSTFIVSSSECLMMRQETALKPHPTSELGFVTHCVSLADLELARLLCVGVKGKCHHAALLNCLFVCLFFETASRLQARLTLNSTEFASATTTGLLFFDLVNTKIVLVRPRQ